MFAGMMARPRATSSRTSSGVMKSGMEAPKLSPRRRVARGAEQPRFSRMAMYSISGVMMPARASWSCVTPPVPRSARRRAGRGSDARPEREIGARRPNDSASLRRHCPDQVVGVGIRLSARLASSTPSGTDQYSGEIPHCQESCVTSSARVWLAGRRSQNVGIAMAGLEANAGSGRLEPPPLIPLQALRVPALRRLPTPVHQARFPLDYGYDRANMLSEWLASGRPALQTADSNHARLLRSSRFRGVAPDRGWWSTGRRGRIACSREGVTLPDDDRPPAGLLAGAIGSQICPPDLTALQLRSS